MRRVYDYDGSKQPEHQAAAARVARLGQVWEDEDGWVFFVVGEAKCVVWHEDGGPITFRHGTLTMDEHGNVVDFPLEETIDRPLEVTHFVRLA